MKASIKLQALFTQDFLNKNPHIVIDDLIDFLEPESFNPETQKLGAIILVNGVATHEVIDLTPEEIDEQNLSMLALTEKYPELQGMNYRLLQLDNLPEIQRLEPISDKGLKGVKKYVKDGVLIWSIETKFWFENDSNFPEGVVKTVKLYDIGERVVDSWTKKVNLSADDKEVIRKEQRERILSYFKSQQSSLFDFLYTFFKTEIDEYIRTGDKQKFQDVLIWAKFNHPYQDENEVYIVRVTLSMEVPRVSGGTTTVLNGILEELV
jgi:hypothetical protein